MSFLGRRQKGSSATLSICYPLGFYTSHKSGRPFRTPGALRTIIFHSLQIHMFYIHPDTGNPRRESREFGGAREKEMVWGILKGWGPEVSALKIRKREEILIRVPGECLHFSFFYQFNPSEHQDLRRGGKICLRKGEVHGRGNSLGQWSPTFLYLYTH